MTKLTRVQNEIHLLRTSSGSNDVNMAQVERYYSPMQIIC